jgi:uncharacterized protein
VARRMYIVTTVAPYTDGPAGVHGVLPQASAAFAELAELAGLEPVRVTDVADLPETVGDEPAVLALFTIGETPFSDAQRRSLSDGWRSGRLPILAVHSTTDSSHTWGEFGQMLGARFDGHPWTQAFDITVTEPSHPATRGLPDPWPWHDEVYLFKDVRPDATVLLQMADGQVDLSVPDGRVPRAGFPLAWCLADGPARTFYSALGHFPLAWETPAHLRYLAGALDWLLTGVDA